MQVDQIVSGRSAAALFCRRSADQLGDPTGHFLRTAAEAFDAEVELAREAFSAFIPRFDGNDEPREAWLSDPKQRKTGAQAIRAMLQQERIAMTALENSLA